MNDKVALDLLQQRAHSLDKHFRDNEYHIERLMHALATSGDPGRVIEGLQDYNNRQNGLMFELGKIQAQIEDLEHRIREHADREREGVLGQEFADAQPIRQEDYLDWLRPALEAPEITPALDDRHPHHQGEERMLQEMHREDREPEDYLDWWNDKR